jgi:hypothetical protein
MNFAQTKEHNHNVEQVFTYLRRHKLSVEDLIDIGGEDLQSPDSRKVERARHAGQAWQMLARLKIHFADLEHDEHVEHH